MSTPRSSILAAVALTLLLNAGAHAQSQAPMGSTTFVRPAAVSPLQTRFVRPPAPAYQQRAAAPLRVAKPFSGVQQTSGLSPYLALDARESEDSLPNYYMFVKPQLDQQRYNAVQQAQYQRLQGQVNAAASMASGPPVDNAATADYRNRFLNYGGYYPTRR